MAYPNNTGYLYSFQSLTLAEGAAIFTGLKGWNVSATIDGEKIVYTEGRKAAGRTRGVLKVEGSVMLLLEDVMAYAKAHPGMLDEIHTVTGTLEDGSTRVKQTLRALRFLELPIDMKGTDEIEVTLKFTAFDFAIDGVSVVQGDDLGLAIEVG